MELVQASVLLLHWLIGLVSFVCVRFVVVGRCNMDVGLSIMCLSFELGLNLKEVALEHVISRSCWLYQCSCGAPASCHDCNESLDRVKCLVRD